MTDGVLNEELIRRLPLPLAQLYRRAYNAKTPFDKHLSAYYLWEATLKLLASSVVVTFAEGGGHDAEAAERLKNFLWRPALGHFWEIVRTLLPILAENVDSPFAPLRELVLGPPREDMPRAATLHSLLREIMGDQRTVRRNVRIGELFEELVRYRNREIGHGAAGQRGSEFYDRMGGALLAGIEEILQRLDPLLGGRLVYISEVRSLASGEWQVERFALAGEGPRRLEALRMPSGEASRLPLIERLYWELPGDLSNRAVPDSESRIALRSLHPLLILDQEPEEVLFLHAVRGKRRAEYVGYGTGRIVDRRDLEADQRGLLARILGVSVDAMSLEENVPEPPAESANADEPASSFRIGEFELLSELGRGGMGVVYRAWQPSLGRQVALKCVLGSGDPRIEARFTREIQALGRVEHPNLVKIFTSGSENERWFYAMELIEGATLAQVMNTLENRQPARSLDLETWSQALQLTVTTARNSERAISENPPSIPRVAAPAPRSSVFGESYVRHAVELIRQAGAAAHALHEAGIVHRDIKPDSIMLTSDGAQAVLMDLGLARFVDRDEGARITISRQFVGTLRYASPEQLFSAAEVDRRADVYSLGATLWELLTLRRLFGADEGMPTPELMLKIQTTEPGSPRRHNMNVPADLEAIVLMCLEKDRNRRYATAEELAEDLGRWLREEPVLARAPSTFYRLSKYLRRHRAVVGTAASITFLGLVSGAALIHQRSLILSLRAEVAQYQTEVNSLKALALARAGGSGPGPQKVLDLPSGNEVYLFYSGHGAVPLADDAESLRKTLAAQTSVQNPTHAAPTSGPRYEWSPLLGWIAAGLVFSTWMGTRLYGKRWARSISETVRDAESSDSPGAPRRDPPPPNPAVDPSPAFSSETVQHHYPAPIALAYRRFRESKDPHDRLDKLFRVFEAAVRYSVYLGFADLFHCLARSGHENVELPAADGFDVLREPVKMTLGRWVTALCATASALAKQDGRFIRELPNTFRPGGLDEAFLRGIVDERNDFEHPPGGVPHTPKKCRKWIEEVRPRIMLLLEEFRFAERYPLGFFTGGQPPERNSSTRRYRVHSCMGPHVATAREAFRFDIQESAQLPLGTPFVASPDGSQVLYLWPFILQHESETAQRPTLYILDGIPEHREVRDPAVTSKEDVKWLTWICSAAIDIDDAWVQRLSGDPEQDHAWLLEKLSKRYPPHSVPPEVKLTEGLVDPVGGDLKGETLGGYHLLYPIGRGGFGKIYYAEDSEGKSFAVKAVVSEDELDQLPRVQLEYRKMSSLGREHPGIIQCYDSGSKILGRRLSCFWYAMEYAACGDLGSRIAERGGKLKKKVAWSVADFRAQIIAEYRAIVDAVSFIHGRDIIHRDIKPGNILIVEGGSLRLSDFGFVKDLAHVPSGQSIGPPSSYGAAVGTRLYMAPEQARGEAVLKTADVYSLGILLAELAIGRRPESDFRGGSTLDRCADLARLPDALQLLVKQCTSSDPAYRPLDAQHVRHEFERAILPS